MASLGLHAGIALTHVQPQQLSLTSEEDSRMPLVLDLVADTTTQVCFLLEVEPGPFLELRLQKLSSIVALKEENPFCLLFHKFQD